MLSGEYITSVLQNFCFHDLDRHQDTSSVMEEQLHLKRQYIPATLHYIPEVTAARTPGRTRSYEYR